MAKTDKNTKEVNVDPTAILDPSVQLDSGVTIGAYSIIGKGVRIGKDTVIGPHVVIGERRAIGERCRVFQFASVGAPPQDLAYKGEETDAIIGDENVIREFVTIHRGTVKDKGVTICGNGNLFMNYTHVAHDCIVGNGVVMANAATLAGHVKVDDHAIVGGLVAVHQYVTIGTHCIIGGASAVSKDIPPYVMAVGNRARIFGLNSVGLRRHGFKKSNLDEIRSAYNILFKSQLNLKEATAKLSDEMGDSKYAKTFLDFIEESTRGIARESTKRKLDQDSSD